MVYSLYLRDKAEQALRLARDSTDQMLVRGLIEDAAEYLGRAEAIDLVESLKEVAADFGVDPLGADVSRSLRSGSSASLPAARAHRDRRRITASPE
jgi:hypothetical protein